LYSWGSESGYSSFLNSFSLEVQAGLLFKFFVWLVSICMNCVANVILGDFQWLVLYMIIYSYMSFSLLCCCFWMLTTDSQFTRDRTEVEHWGTVCRGRPCTRRILVAESPSVLLYSSVLLCMALLLQIAVLMVFIWIFPSVKMHSDLFGSHYR
jgi:hypothetical protein